MTVGFVKISEKDYHFGLSEVAKQPHKKIKELYLDEKSGKIFFVLENERRVDKDKKICYNIFENKNEREDNPFL